MEKPFDLLIAVVSHRTVSAPTVNSLEQLRLNNNKFNYSLGLFIGDALIGRGRSQACSKFLDETQIPYLLFIDDDIVFSPKDVETIYTHLTGGYDIIGGIYPVRGAGQLSSYGWGGALQVNAGIQEIEYLATGFMGISRKLLEKMRSELKLPLLNPNDWSRCYPFFENGRFVNRTHGGDPIYISEDWDFCEKVRLVGGKIYADTNVKLGHMREQVFSPDDVRDLQYKEVMQKKIYGAMNHQAELMRSIDTDLGEFLGQTPSYIRKRMGESVKNDFYGLAKSNQGSNYYEDKVSQLVNINSQKILDIGCGIGTLVFIMAEENNEVIGWDTNPMNIDFCKFKKKKYNLSGEFVVEKPDYSLFDLITSIDVQNTKEFILDLGQHMKYGTKLYHVETIEDLQQWLKESGLISWNERWCIKA